MNENWWVFPRVILAYVLVFALVFSLSMAIISLPSITGATAPTTQEQRISALETKVKNLESDWDRFIRQNNKLKK